MIQNFTGPNKKKLKLCSQGDYSKFPSSQAETIEIILNILDTATCIDDFDLPGKRLHTHTNTDPKVWSLDVSGNYRILFEFDGTHVKNVSYEDPH